MKMQNSENRSVQGPVDPSFMHYSNIPGYASGKQRGGKKAASSSIKLQHHNKQIASATRAQRAAKPIG